VLEVFAHAADQEDLVVHGEAEEHSDEQDGEEGHHGCGGGDSEGVGEVAVLEDPDGEAEAGRGGQQEAEYGLEGDQQ
jgi:hypothetical protein